MTTTCYDLNDSSEQGVLAHLDACDGLGFEVLWMDAYWHDGGFPVGVGNKTDFERYPNGLGYIGENAHEAGMEFLLWHDIERVSLGTEMDRLHPDWLLSADGRDCKLFNLGNPDALDYITQFMIREVDEKNIDWLRMDPCIDYLPYWRHADPPGRVGMTEMRYVEGLYKLVDTLLDAHPHLNIDNCGGGARRVDLEMCKRATVLWRIDLTTIIRERERDYGLAAMLDQAMITGLSHYLPYHCCGVYRERPYWFRSCLNAGVVFLDDLRYEFYPRDTLRAAIEEA
jgi:alpha-galactosidase